MTEQEASRPGRDDYLKAGGHVNRWGEEASASPPSPPLKPEATQPEQEWQSYLLLGDFEYVSLREVEAKLREVTAERDRFYDALAQIEASGYHSSPSTTSRMIKDATAAIKGKQPSHVHELLTEYAENFKAQEQELARLRLSLAQVEQFCDGTSAGPYLMAGIREFVQQALRDQEGSPEPR